MTTRYLIQEIDGTGFWSKGYRRFKGFLFADQFESEDQALIYAKKECIGIFKIIKIYDTRE